MSFRDLSRKIRSSLGKFLFDKRTRAASPLDMGKARSILFCRYADKVGDMVIATMIFREVKRAYPHIKVSVMCGKNSAHIIKHNPYVDEIVTPQGFDPVCFLKLKGKIDIAYDFDYAPPRFSQLLMWRLIAPKLLIGANKESYNIYGLSLELTDVIFTHHITLWHKRFLSLLGIENPSPDYDIFIPDDIKEGVRNRLLPLSTAEKRGSEGYPPILEERKLKVLINPFAGGKNRNLSASKVKEILSTLKGDNRVFFILCHRKVTEFAVPEGVNILEVATPLESAAAVALSDIIITPDTAVVHMASAFKKKTVAIYRDYRESAEKIDLIWAPNNPNAVVVHADNKTGNSLENVSIGVIAEAFKKL